MPTSFVLIATLCGCAGQAALSDQGAAKKSSQKNPDKTELASDPEPNSSESESSEDSDLRVIPPEVVTGAYLTCGPDKETATSDRVVFECGASFENGAPLDLAGFMQSWRLLDVRTKDEVDAAVVDAVSSKTRIARSWTMRAEVYNRGVFAKVDLKGAQDTSASLESVRPTIINGTIADKID